MKKLLLSLAALCGLVACSKDKGLEIWKSEVYDYSGRFEFQVAAESNPDEAIIPFGESELRIYNSSDNKANELWIEDHKHKIPLKSLFVISRDGKSFKSAVSGFEAQTNNLYGIVLPKREEKVGSPKTIGEIAVVERNAVRAELLEGKIEANAYKTLGNNMADKLYLKLRLYAGKVKFESVEKPKDEWEKPNVPEYKWMFKDVEDLKKPEVYIITAHRFTGFAEDVYH